VPDALIERMRASRCIALETPLEARVDLLLDEYRHFLENKPALDAQLDCLAALHGRERIAQWKALTDWRELVTRLLLEHYDPAYRRSSSRNFPQLPAARRIHIPRADDSAFMNAAHSVIELSAVPA
jgi:tRNA 2-selenouridine synthase